MITSRICLFTYNDFENSNSAESSLNSMEFEILICLILPVDT